MKCYECGEIYESCRLASDGGHTCLKPYQLNFQKKCAETFAIGIAGQILNNKLLLDEQLRILGIIALRLQEAKEDGR